MLLLKRKIVSAITLTLLLAGTLTLAFNIQTVKASGTIYIRGDGSIDPPTSSISTVDNVTYTFAGDINDSIVIERDNIVVDGALQIVEGTGSGNGITFSGRTNVTIKNMTIKAFYYGIYLDHSSGNNISGNNITNNGYGIELAYGSNNIIFHNNFIDNTIQAASYVSADVWDDGYPSGGNYWSNYNGTDFYKGPYQNETGSDGIGDMPYVIDQNNQDGYPFMFPIVPLLGDLNHDGIVNIFDAIQAASAFGSSPGHPNWNSQADLNNDNVIDIFDFIILAGNFEKTTV